MNRVTKLGARQIKSDGVNMMLDGKRWSEVIAYLQEKYSLSEENAKGFYKSSTQELYAFRASNADHIITLHVQRYEHIYEQLIAAGARSQAMQAMTQKEELLGLHKEDLSLKIDQSTLKANFVSAQYDPKSLSEDKQKRFAELMGKLGQLDFD